MIKKFFLPIMAAAAFAACSDIADDDRFIVIDGVEQRRTVLIEEFTGQNCPNCPTAHKEIETLVGQYPDALIAVSIHAGDFGISSTARRPGLMQPEGNIYNNRYGIDEWPKGVVNGRGGARNFDEWSDAVRDELKRETPLGIDIAAQASADTPATITVDCSLLSTADLAGTLHIWIVESGIVARQVDKDLGLITDYVHDHVYRAAVNGVDGEALALKAHISSQLQHSIAARATDSETWNIDNLSVVAFVRLPDGSVAQAAQCKVAI